MSKSAAASRSLRIIAVVFPAAREADAARDDSQRRFLDAEQRVQGHVQQRKVVAQAITSAIADLSASLAKLQLDVEDLLERRKKRQAELEAERPLTKSQLLEIVSDELAKESRRFWQPHSNGHGS